jgi:beta-lactamase regulating signal transducer with metallopeptidase domain
MSNAAAFQALLVLAAYAIATTVVFCVAWLTTRLTTRLIRRNAAVQHLIWLTAFSVVLLVPLSAAVAPAGFVLRASLPSLPAAASASLENARQPLLSVAGVGESGTLRSVLAVPEPQSAAPLTLSTVSTLSAPSVPLRTVAAVLESRDYRSRVLCSLLGLWGIGFSFVVVQMLAGAWGIRSLLQRSTPVPIGTASTSTCSIHRIDRDALSRRAGLRRAWELRISTRPGLPTAMTWGVFCPVVLLPQESGSWSEPQAEAVLLHELAHVRRCDSLSQMLAQIVCALHWFNPLVWWSAGDLRTQAEMAADDAVLRGGVRASTYAGDLLRVAWEAQEPQNHRKNRRQVHGQRFTAAGVPFLRQPGIESRIRSIVSPQRCRGGVATVHVLTASGASLFFIVLLCSLRPEVLVRYDSQAAPQGLTLALTRPPRQAVTPDLGEIVRRGRRHLRVVTGTDEFALKMRLKSVLRRAEEAACRRAGTVPRRLKRLADAGIGIPGLVPPTHSPP